jgi:ADP-heptose:LPS heptosyltransferase
MLQFEKLGDSLIMTPLLEGISRCSGGNQIFVIGSSLAGEVFRGNPHVTRFVQTDARPHRSLREFFDLVSLCRRLVRKWSITTVVLDAEMSRPYPALLARFLPVRHRLAIGRVKYQRLTCRGFHHVEPEVEIDRDFSASVLEHNLRLLDALGCPRDGVRVRVFPSAAEKRRARAFMAGLKLDPSRPTVAFAPYSSQAMSAWPSSHVLRFAHLAARQFNLVVFGAPHEAEKWATDTSVEPCSAHEAFGLNIREAAVAIDCADAFVVLNTGSSHLFQTLSIPMLRLDHHAQPFQLWGYEGDPRYHFLRNPVPCGPCFSGTCSVEGHPCMSGITPERVITAIIKILGETRGSAST